MAEIIKNETVSCIINRRSIRAYTAQKLTEDEVNTLLSAALWAPSARNLQPLTVRALTDKNALDAINADFKKKVGENTPAYTRWDVNPVYQGAPSLFLIYGGAENNLDAGIAVQNIAIAAESLNLGSVIIGSVGELMNAPEGEKWKKALNVNDESCFLISIAVGHKAEQPDPKERKPENYTEIKKVNL